MIILCNWTSEQFLAANFVQLCTFLVAEIDDAGGLCAGVAAERVGGPDVDQPLPVRDDGVVAAGPAVGTGVPRVSVL